MSDIVSAVLTTHKMKAQIHLVYLNDLPIDENYPGITSIIKRGDIVENVAESGYRADGVYFWDGVKLVEPYRDFDPYGTPPAEFRVLEEFPPGYWDYDFDNDEQQNYVTDWTKSNQKSYFYWHCPEDELPCAVDASIIYPADETVDKIVTTVTCKFGSYNVIINEPTQFNNEQAKYGFVGMMTRRIDGEICLVYR